MKSFTLSGTAKPIGRSPHGGRGLKCERDGKKVATFGSLPAWGAWIEIKMREKAHELALVAPRMGGVD